MEKQKNIFVLDLDRLQQQQQKQNLSDSQLSESIGKSRTWLYTIKNRMDGPKIKETDAQRIADRLNCTLQDIRKENEERLWNPIDFYHEVRVRNCLEKLLPADAKCTADILEFLVGATEEQKNDLMAYIFEGTRYVREKIEVPMDQWWKVLYIFKISEAVLKCLDSKYPTGYIFDRYHLKLKEMEAQKQEEAKKQGATEKLEDNQQPQEEPLPKDKFAMEIRCMEDVLTEATRTTTSFLGAIEDILGGRVISGDKCPWASGKSMMTQHDLVLYDCAEILVKHFHEIDVDYDIYIKNLKSKADLRRFYLNLLTNEGKEEKKAL